MNVIEIILWLLFFLIFYTYLGYPLLLWVITRFYTVKREIDEQYCPKVSVLVAVYNEVGYIEHKLENTLDLDYPKEKLDIIAFSDGSDDGSDDIIKRYGHKGVRYLRVEGRKGKTICQNEAVKISKGEIIVFTDTKAMLEPAAIRKLVRHFSDQKVGSVLGKLVYRNDKGNIKEGAYWRLEQWIKNTESKLFGSISGTGAIYSVRRKEYIPLPNYAQSDFTEPIAGLIKYGGVPVTDPEVVAYNLSAGTSGKEFKRHERIITRYLFTRKIVKEAYNPFKVGLYALGLISHKSLRFYAPFLLIATLVLNVYLVRINNYWYILLLGQVVAYLLALVGYFLDRKDKGSAIFSIPYHFVILNLAALKAWVNYLRGKNFVTWKLKGA